MQNIDVNPHEIGLAAGNLVRIEGIHEFHMKLARPLSYHSEAIAAGVDGRAFRKTQQVVHVIKRRRSLANFRPKRRRCLRIGAFQRQGPVQAVVGEVFRKFPGSGLLVNLAC